MALVDIRHEIVLALAQIHDAEHEAEALLAHGEDPDKVAAAGELDFLRRQDARLRARLAEVDRRIASHRDSIFGWFRQEWFNLMLQLENWIAHG